MKLSSEDLHELAELAIRAATEAGQMIARSRPQEIEHKEGGHSLSSQVVTEVDRQAEDLILRVLAPTFDRFELGLLSEETDDNGGRLIADYFWCIDPLDGTLPFIEGTPGYAVSIALVDQSGTPMIGVVYDPVEGALFHAVSGAGAFRNRAPWSIDSAAGGAELSVFTDRSFFALENHDEVVAALDEIARDLGLAGVRIHEPRGAVMNALGVLALPNACYFKFPKPTAGGGSLWDFAATACLFHEVGAIATNIHGDVLDLNRANSTFMNHQGVLFATCDIKARLALLHSLP